MREPPDELFHYTSAAGLYGILSSRSLWTTMISYLSDRKEFSYAVEIAHKVLVDRAQHANAPLLRDFYNRFSESFRWLQKPDVCVFCLTEDPDLLSQWRGYTPPDGGYSIGFDSSALRRILIREHSRLVPCTYDTIEQGALLAEALDSAVSGVLAQLATPSRAELDQLVESALGAFVRDFVEIAPSIKHPSFKEEREWRLVSRIVLGKDDQLNFRPASGVLLPYYKLDLDNGDGSIPIRTLVVGPGPHQDLAAQAVLLFFERSGLPELGA